MSERVGAAMRRTVADRAGHRCEYFGLPDWEAVVPHEPDHIIAVQHGGQTEFDNLAYACFERNRVKGSNIASVDPASGQITPLFHPRLQQWNQHFRWNGALIEPLTATGRATALFLRLNETVQVEIRANLQRQGRFLRYRWAEESCTGSARPRATTATT